MAPLIVQCGAGKLPGAHRVADLYTGPLWSTLRRVERETGIARDVYVLSAKYGIVRMDKVIESYDAQAVDRVTEAHHVHVTELVQLVQAQGWNLCRVDFVGSALYAKVLEDAGCIVTRLESRGIGYQRAALAKALT
ncbi:MAG: hypothetical protein JHD30_04805 [Chloroflexi bacterium]|nr:hypothetical protein [Chloroflexota bacterium]